ncbi:MAG: flagellar basal body rod protein FlgC [Pirellulales bacterium]
MKTDRPTLPPNSIQIAFETDENLVAAGGAPGVKVASVEKSQAEPLYRYQPEHPLAIKEGKWKAMAYPNVNLKRADGGRTRSNSIVRGQHRGMEITKNMGRSHHHCLAVSLTQRL